ncbi:MAG: hypothetical protein ACXW2P_01225 [Thermoanaerobaculia bacterium]
MSRTHDGDPRQMVSSFAGGGIEAGRIGAVAAGEGRPQWGHVGARVDTSRPQSGQAMTGMPGL